MFNNWEYLTKKDPIKQSPRKKIITLFYSVAITSSSNIDDFMVLKDLRVEGGDVVAFKVEILGNDSTSMNTELKQNLQMRILGQKILSDGSFNIALKPMSNEFFKFSLVGVRINLNIFYYYFIGRNVINIFNKFLTEGVITTTQIQNNNLAY